VKQMKKNKTKWKSSRLSKQAQMRLSTQSIQMIT
jgi:hypothetical protein